MGIDKSQSVMESAMLDGTIDGVLDLENEKCDILVVALYPDDIIEFVTSHADYLEDTIVIDCGGTKTKVCDTLFPLAKQKRIAAWTAVEKKK